MKFLKLCNDIYINFSTLECELSRKCGKLYKHEWLFDLINQPSETSEKDKDVPLISKRMRTILLRSVEFQNIRFIHEGFCSS